MKKMIAILLVLAMLLPLAACGGEDDPNAGKYQGVSAAVGGFSMPMSDIYPGETWLELKSGGKGTIMLDGDDFSIKWSLDGEDITISVQGVDSVGTLKNGIITVDLMNMGCVMTFEKEGGAAYESGSDKLGSIGDKVAGSKSDKISGKAGTDTPDAEENSELGVYAGTTYEYSDQVFNMTDIYGSLCTIELLDDGKGIFVLGEETMNCTWTLDGEDFVLTNQYVDSPGTLVDDTMTINFMGMGMIMTFVKDSSAAPQAPEVPEAPEAPDVSDKKTSKTDASSKKPSKTDTVSSGGANSYQIEEYYSHTVTTVNFTLPESMWVVDVPSHTLYLYNVESQDKAYSNSPRIQFETYKDLDGLNIYMKHFENLQEIESRTIGGIAMQGRTYKNVGMQWTEYYAELPNGLWMSVKISKTSVDPGSEGSDILDSVTFE